MATSRFQARAPRFPVRRHPLAAISSALIVLFSAKKARMSRTKSRATSGGSSSGLRGIGLATFISIAGRNWTQLLGDDITMSSPDHIDLLCRAFKAAWEYYFQPSRNGGVLECLARPALARFLAEKTREGITDEPSLAAAGLQFLFSLEDDPPEETVDEPDVSWNLHLKNASAHFVPVGHVQVVFRRSVNALVPR